MRIGDSLPAAAAPSALVLQLCPSLLAFHLATPTAVTPALLWWQTKPARAFIILRFAATECTLGIVPTPRAVADCTLHPACSMPHACSTKARCESANAGPRNEPHLRGHLARPSSGNHTREKSLPFALQDAHHVATMSRLCTGACLHGHLRKMGELLL